MLVSAHFTTIEMVLHMLRFTVINTPTATCISQRGNDKAPFLQAIGHTSLHAPLPLVRLWTVLVSWCPLLQQLYPFNYVTEYVQVHSDIPTRFRSWPHNWSFKWLAVEGTNSSWQPKCKLSGLLLPTKICFHRRTDGENKGRFSMCQHIRNKPTKWGLKLWVLCDSTNGYSMLPINFLYTGVRWNCQFSWTGIWCNATDDWPQK